MRLNNDGSVSRYNYVTLRGGSNDGTIRHRDGRVGSGGGTSRDQIAIAVAGVRNTLGPDADAYDQA